jgi:Bacterial SH3 domain
MNANGFDAVSPASDGHIDRPQTPSQQRDEMLSKIARALTSAEKSSLSKGAVDESFYDQLTALLQAQEPQDARARSVNPADALNDAPAIADRAGGDGAGDHGLKASGTAHDLGRTRAAAAPLAGRHKGNGLRRWSGAFIAGLIMPVAAGGVTLMIDAARVKSPGVIADNESHDKLSVIADPGAIHQWTEDAARVEPARTVEDATIRAAREQTAVSAVETETNAGDRTADRAALVAPIDGTKASPDEPVAAEQESLSPADLAPDGESARQTDDPAKERSSDEASGPAITVQPSTTAREQALPPTTPAPTGARSGQSAIDRGGDAVPRSRTVRMAKAVNLRAGPDNGKAVLTTIPGGALVELVGCRYWCEVVFAGHRGWVYKSFIKLSGSTAVSD